MKTITESELESFRRVPMRARVSLRDGRKQIHILTDAEILQFVKTGKVDIPNDAEWIEVIKDGNT